MELLQKLQKRGFKAYAAQNANDVIKIISDNIPSGATIGFGGSVTVSQLNLPKRLKEEGYVCNHPEASDKAWKNLTENNRYVDYYISSTNAITEDGILVNMDGNANRISQMCYGPKKLFFVLGTNKICENVEAAFKRIEEVAAPLNAKRLKKQTPCAQNDKCFDCDCPDTICKAALVLYHPTSSMEVHVIVVNGIYGY